MGFKSCSPIPEVVTKPTLIVMEPPSALLVPCPKPYKPVTTTGGVVDQLNATRGALKVCSAQVDGLRRWRDENKAK